MGADMAIPTIDNEGFVEAAPVPTPPSPDGADAMAAAFGQVTNFWLGSSHGSKLKTAVMSKGE